MEWFLIGIILTTLFILGASRLTACIRAVAIQGALLSVLPVLVRGSLADPHSFGLFLGTFLIKAVFIPVLLLRSIREVGIRSEGDFHRQARGTRKTRWGSSGGEQDLPLTLASDGFTPRERIDPTFSRHLSLLAGGLFVVLAFSFPSPPDLSQNSLVVPTALAMVLLGFLLLISRTTAVTQVIGFLVLENGVFLFGMTLVAEFPVTVEMGVLLDLLVGIFVMGIMIYHINRTFDHIHTTLLTSLRDI